jgi:hypothetical protein
MISQQWVDSFPGDVCPPPVTRFHLSLGTCCYATCQPRGPHLTDVPRVRTSPRCSALRDFAVEKKFFQPPNPRYAIPTKVLIQRFSHDLDPMVWISFPAPRNSGLRETKNLVCPPNSRTPNLRNDPTMWVETRSTTLIDHDQWFTLILDIRVVSSSNS